MNTRNRAIPVLLTVLGLAAVAASAPACATMGTPTPVATLVIENDSPMQVNIHALRGSARVRIGTVPGVSTREFDLRRDMLDPAGELRLVIDPIGSPRSYPAMPIVVREGDTIELRVGSVIR